jgi:hypothetical protein
MVIRTIDFTPREARRRRVDMYPWKQLKVGGMFVFRSDNEGAARMQASRAGRRYGRTFRVAKDGDEMKCWRVK